MSGERKIYPVILSGGSGTRLWPMSRAFYPKQLLPLVGERTMLQETVRRSSDSDLFAAPTIIANNEHRFIVAEQLKQAGIEPRTIVLEPVGRNTAPAAAIAAMLLVRDDPDAIMAILPSDHSIGKEAAFHAAIRSAAAVAGEGRLVTFGIRPTRPEPGYGYIRRGAPLAQTEGAFEIAAFVEKPERSVAEGYLAAGNYYWNSGMFVFPAQRYLDELARLSPEIVVQSRLALDRGQHDLDFLRLDADALAACPADSIDYAVMERAERAAVIAADLDWSDVGGWYALWEIASRDGNGNVLQGDALVHDVRNSYIRSEDGQLIAVVGMEDCVVVSTADAVMVSSRDRVGEVKEIVELLKAGTRPEALHHRRVYRPWGDYDDIDEGDRFRVKRIVVKPGGKLSLQKHKHRSEHWVVVRGTAVVTRGEEESVLQENQSTYIPKGVAHRLENTGSEPLHLIEVQVGDYVGEDDIVRLEDTYGRA